MSATKPQIPGTGLPLGLFGAIVAVSVALFVVWGGWLWTAPRETSHLARFTVSYLVVVPLAALALLAVHRWSWPHMLAAVATIWCIKLVVTALLYLALARGTAVQLDPARLEPRAPPAEQPLTTYHAATGGDPHGALAGRVTLSGQPLVGSIVYLVAPPPGRPLTPGAPVDLMIEQARYDRPLTLALVGDTVRVHSRDGELHTVHLREELAPTGERVLGNQPLRPGAVVPLPMRKPGRYRLTCDNHRQETAWLIVADHPYATTTGPGGGFYLPAVPAGALRLEALAVTAGGLAQAHRALTLADGATAQIELALAPPAPAAAATLTPSPLMPAHKENTLR
ncbi:MAG TPA: hypothetical protein VH877_14500 [Polyangia bacterium]|nr:hypothetical protein [Polyangia bacterium]